MIFEKIFHKLFNNKKYKSEKFIRKNKEKLEFFKDYLEPEIQNIKSRLNKGEISFLHSGHLGDIVNSLSVIKELSKSNKCNLYLETNKKLERDAIGYKNTNDEIYLNERLVNMLVPLLNEQQYLNKVEKYQRQQIDIDLNLFRKLPMNFNLDSIRWYFFILGIQSDLSKNYLDVGHHPSLRNKIVIMRSTRRKNLFIDYKFMDKCSEEIYFIGLRDEYEDLKKDISKMKYYDCKDFLEAAQIIKSSKFFIGNPSLGFAIAEALKVPRLLESYPDFPVMYPNGGTCYSFYFQIHFEEFFNKLNKR